MGSKPTKTKDSTSLLPNEIQDFHNITSFSENILIKLHNHYKKFSSLQTDDGVIDYAEFSEIMNKDNNMSKRIFNAVDINKDGVINFREFIKYISCFVNGSFDEKVNLSFKLFSDEKTKLISKDQMVQLLNDIIAVEENKFFKNFFTSKDIEFMVEKTFDEISFLISNKNTNNLNSSSNNNNINFIQNLKEFDEENAKEVRKIETLDIKTYKMFIEKNKQILDWLVVDVDKIQMLKDTANKNISKKVNCFGC